MSRPEFTAHRKVLCIAFPGRRNTRSADDRLLASALAFKASRPAEDHVLIVTDDTGLGIKAPARQMETVAPGEHLRIADEPDELEKELDATRRALAAARSIVPKPRITIDGETRIEGAVKPVRDFDTVTIRRLLQDWRKRHPRISGMADSIAMPGGGTFSLRGFAGLPGFVSAEDAMEHNALIDRVFGEYEEYLRDWPAAVNEMARSLRLVFVLENSGTAPAEGVHVELTTDADGIWLEDLPDLPDPPAMPRRRDPFDLSFIDRMPNLDPIDLRHPDRELDGPNLIDTEPQRVEFWVKRLMHHVPLELPRVHFQFASQEAVRSFRIDCRIVAANLPEPKTQALHVKLTIEEPVAPPLPGSAAGEDD